MKRERGELNVLKKRIVIGALAGAAALIPFGGVAAVVGSSPAGAAPPGITCTGLSGTVDLTTDSATIALSGCSGNTGGSGKTSGSESSTTAKVKWKNKDKTKFDDVTNTEQTNTLCASGDVQELNTSTVKSDTTGDTAKGAGESVTICYDPTTNELSLAPGTDYVIDG
jgi:hypothetical protein